MKKDEYFYEVAYQIWERGGNPDLLSQDRAERDFYEGMDPECTSEMEIKRQRKMYNDSNGYDSM